MRRRHRLALAIALGLGGCAQPGAPPVCTAPLKPAVQVDLYFGRSMPAGGQVSDTEWAAFLTEVVTPRFPDGLTVVESAGQYRNASGRIVHEPGKLLVIIVFDPPSQAGKVGEVVASYKQRFSQESVLRTEQAVCAGL